MTSLAHVFSAALLHFFWQGLLVGIVLRIALAILRKAPAGTRYLASCAALAAMAALPLITSWMLYSPSAAPVPRVLAPAHRSVTDGVVSTIATSLPAWITGLERWALPVWVAGVLIFALRLIGSSAYLAKLRRRGEAAGAPLVEMMSRLAVRMKISRPVRLLVSTLTDTPSVAGWVRPVVLLPAATLLNLGVKDVEALLAHELAHIRRHDYLVNVLQTLAETLLFYHPAVWWVSSRIRHERELCCDDLAIASCGDAAGYARALSRLERLRLAAPEPALGAGGGSLLYRIQRLTATAQEQAPSKFPAVLALTLALGCLGIGLYRVQAQPQAPRGEAVVRQEAIWTDTVKYGDMPVMVRALGKITSPRSAELDVPVSLAGLVHAGQSASLDVRRGITIDGTVARVEPSAIGSTVVATVELQSEAPEFTGQPADAAIHIRILKNVLHIGRPVIARGDAEATVFKLDPDGKQATRVKVRFGTPSVNRIQIVEGLQAGDRIIVSDMSKYDGYDRVRLE